MNTKRLAAKTMLCLMATATPALAAQGMGEDHSGWVVGVFLVFCALIVIAQLAPVLTLWVGMLRELLTFKGKPRVSSPSNRQVPT